MKEQIKVVVIVAVIALVGGVALGVAGKAGAEELKKGASDVLVLGDLDLHLLKAAIQSESAPAEIALHKGSSGSAEIAPKGAVLASNVLSNK